MFVGPGSEKTWKHDRWETGHPNDNWDRRASQILQKTYTKYPDTHAAGTTMFEQGTLKQNSEGKESIHFNV